MPLAITMYTLSTAIHVVFVVSFIGTTGAFGIIGPMSKEEPQHAEFTLKFIKKAYETMVFPGLLVVWGTGIYQSADGPWKGGDLWLTISVVLFALMSLAAVFVMYPAVKFVLAEFAAKTEPGPPSPEAQKKLALFGKVGPAMGVSLMVITFLMVAKPF